MSFSTGKEGASAGAVDEEDFMKAFEDVPTVQVKLHMQYKKCLDKMRNVMRQVKHNFNVQLHAMSF